MLEKHMFSNHFGVYSDGVYISEHLSQAQNNIIILCHVKSNDFNCATISQLYIHLRFYMLNSLK